MQKLFDINPPKLKKQTIKSENPLPVSKKVKLKNSNNIILTIFIFIVVIVLFSILNNQNFSSFNTQKNNSDELSQIETLITNSTENNLLTDSPAPTASSVLDPLKNQSQVIKSTIKIIVLNGSRDFNNTNDVKQILENNDISIFEIGDTQNIYDASAIYFTSVNASLAEKIKSILPNYNINMIEDEIMASNDKIIIVVSKKNEN